MSDRHEKWTRVEPGTVIPAGQPYRVEFADENLVAAREHRGDIQPFFADPRTVRPGGDPNAVYFVDSSWKPPLVLPTEPTWGIVRHHHGNNVPSPLLTKAERNDYETPFLGNDYGLSTHRGTIPANQVEDFIPLTDEQVARIEAAR